MEDKFAKRVRAAAAAGWWTLLIVYGVLTIQWLFYLYVMSHQPGWVLKLMGEGITWQISQPLWLYGIAVFKIGALMLTVVVLWLTLWGRRLSRLE